MDKKESLMISAIALAMLIFMRLFGPTQSVFTWTFTTTRISNALLIIVFSIMLFQFTDLLLKHGRIKILAKYFIVLSGTISIFFAYHNNLMGLGISVGIAAAVLTYLFQMPLLNIVSWIYLQSERVYREGDRIKISNIKGDVIEITPMQTTLLEVGGDYIKSDQLSGKLVKFPNSLLLSQPVLNYTYRFPYLWVDIPFQLSFETDIHFVKKNIEFIVKHYLKDDLEKMKAAYEYSIGKHDGKFEIISFNLTPVNQWLELRVTFPVKPKKQSEITTNITEAVIHSFNKYPDKIQFPKGRTR